MKIKFIDTSGYFECREIDNPKETIRLIWYSKSIRGDLCSGIVPVRERVFKRFMMDSIYAVYREVEQ